MSTFGNMVRRIRSDINRGSDFEARIKEAISDAIVFYTPKRLGFNVKRSEALLRSGMEIVSTPLDWIENDYLRLEDDGQRIEIEEVDYDTIEGLLTRDDITGRPHKYAIHNREIRFYPIPDKSYTLVLSFQCTIDGISPSASDLTTNEWMVEGERLIRNHAQGQVLFNYIDGEEAVAKGVALMNYAEKVILPNMERRAAREQSSGKLKAHL